VSEITRRALLERGAAAAAGAVLAGGVPAQAVQRPKSRRRLHTDFAALGAGDGWPGWRTAGVANLRRSGGEGLLEAGSDVFPNDPRPVALALESVMRDGEIEAVLSRVGKAPGLVLRRVSPRAYYAAVYDTSAAALRIIRRVGVELEELSRTPVPPSGGPLAFRFEARSTTSTWLRATLTTPDGAAFVAEAADVTRTLQRPGSAGVFATADTLFPSDRNPVLPALGNLHLLPWAIQEGQAVMNTAVGEVIVGEIRRRSTAGFRSIEVRSHRRLAPAAPRVVASTSGVPVRGGATLHVAADGPARVELEISRTPRFRDPVRVDAGRTGGQWSVSTVVRGLPPGRRIYWRARVRGKGGSSTGPTRSFRVLPGPASEAPVTIAVGACASQFGPIFDRLAERDPDVFVWQGDLNYPDTHGPLAQSVPGYAGIWRDFLANPRLTPILARSCFAAQRDDHDYAVQDANRDSIPSHPWALSPWEKLVSGRTYYRFRAGLVDVWVLDQRRFKTDPEAPDTSDKTLLGKKQRRWLLRTLAASRAPFKVICSPVTVTDPLANPRDGNWGAGFTAERDLVLEHVRRVGGRTLFLTGDTHVTMVRDHDGVFEARACPLDIPQPRDTTLTQPLYPVQLEASPGVVYASDQSHFSLLEVRRHGTRAILEYSIVREDGHVPYRKRFEAGGSATLARS
jgi:hypothetical protein